MKNFHKKLREFKLQTVGAACYEDRLSGQKHCANGLTEEAAKQYEKQEGLRLIKWHPGKRCSEVNC